MTTNETFGSPHHSPELDIDAIREIDGKKQFAWALKPESLPSSTNSSLKQEYGSFRSPPLPGADTVETGRLGSMQCMLAKQDGRKAVTYEGRPLRKGKRSRSTTKVDLGCSLNRLPASYCWQLLELLTTELNDYITVPLRDELRLIARKRDIKGYYELNNLYGLQSMAHWGRPEPGNPAMVRLLVSVIRKHENMCLVGKAERKLRCLESVKTIDAGLRPVPTDAACDPVYVAMRSVISQVLGTAPDVASIASGSRHGPGSSSVGSYIDRSAYFKYEDWPYAVGPRARSLLVDVIKLDQRWLGSLEDSFRDRYNIPKWRLLNQEMFLNSVVHSEHNWNRITSVPKDGQKDRPIAIEPVGNIYLQLGVGHILRTLLRAAGLDLNKQQDVNRSAALEASRSQRLFTIDLSNASDTVSLEFVRFVMPSDWFELLCSLRSPYGLLPSGEGWRYAKFSSMGNGFTFELETLLFWCLSIAISMVFGRRQDTRLVFGDDIIGESYLYRHHCVYLEASGFSTNLEKSFALGRAAESCGVDAMDGIDIRPVFVKRDPRNVLELYNDRNRLNRWWVTHTGSPLPASIDKFFLGFIRGELLVGPDSDCEFDSYWHDGVWPEGRTFSSLSRRTSERPAKDLRFRKLMHTLRSCEGEGGQFLVADVSERWARLVDRVVTGFSGYRR